MSFKDVGREDVALVGGKGANLGEMTKAGFPVPPGFIVTSHAYYDFLDQNHLREQIKKILSTLDRNDTAKLTKTSREIRSLINHSPVPDKLARQIMNAYLSLGSEKTLVAVRSSATAEDLPDASFAGQQDTFLNVSGEANVMEKVRDAWSSLFTPRAIFYRTQKHFDHFKVGIAIPIQRMVQSESSGVMFTINPITNDKSVVVIEGIWGLGELIVQGSVTPDRWEVLKRNWEIVKRQTHTQNIMMTKSVTDHEIQNVLLKVPKTKRSVPKLSDNQVVQLAKIAVKLHQHYFFPQDSEWAIEKGKIFIVQTRPITTIAEMAGKQAAGGVPAGAATKGLEKLVNGEPASPGLVSGPAKVITSVKEIGRVKAGDVLVMKMTSPDFVPAIRKAVAIVTDEGGQTSHAAIVSRELGIVCVVGTKLATKKLKTGMVITVNGSTGDVFKGAPIQSSKSIFQQAPSPAVSASLPALPADFKTATKLYVNLAEPDLAEKIAAENVDGVGLLRAEFMMAQIGVHPKKAIHDGKAREFTQELSQGLIKFAKAFSPRPVVYRATDFRTNEYRNLRGGEKYEPQEENPMIGFRGAFRYVSDPDVFELELAAIRHVREKYANIHLMIPFVRSVEELKEVKKLVYASGLKRSPSFHFWMMTELPVNVISIDEFLDVGIDGISVGTNDLTMLTLGVDRDNEHVASDYSELNPAVLWSLKRLITAAGRRRVTSSVCGQAPSLYPELSEKLVSWGITSVSVAPDRIDPTRELLYRAEKKLISK